MAFSLDDRPKLRWPLELDRFSHKGKNYLVLKDHQGVAKEPALIPEECVPIISRFDGALTISEIASQGASVGLTPVFVAQLAEELSRLSFMDTEETQAIWGEMLETFRSQPVRPPALAGVAYSSDPEVLKRELEAFIAQSRSKVAKNQNILGIMAPHIDYARGGITYGEAYRALEAAETPDVIVLIGTSHFGGESLFQMSSKDFASPLGVLPAAREVIEDIAKRYGLTRAFRDEYFHRREHSLELQLPFLTYRFRESKKPKIVPIIVGSFYKYLKENLFPLDDGETSDFVGALGEAIRTLLLSGRRVMFYAGVDLAHMGRHFGDTEPTALPQIERRDKELIEALLCAREDKLFAHMVEDLDRRRICGFPSLFTLLAASRTAGLSLNGKLLDYRQAVDPSSDCIVTFASLYWT